MTRPLPSQVSDAAKRIYDTYALHRVADLAGSIGKWFAFRLSDGTTDGVLYDTKADAVRHQHHDERFMGFVRIMPSMQVEDFQGFLNLHRKLYDAGLTFADPDHRAGGADMIRRATREDQRTQLRALFRGDMPPSNIQHNPSPN